MLHSKCICKFVQIKHPKCRNVIRINIVYTRMNRMYYNPSAIVCLYIVYMFVDLSSSRIKMTSCSLDAKIGLHNLILIAANLLRVFVYLLPNAYI